MLLRGLQENVYTPIGSGRERISDVRVISATNENMELAIKEGRFRDCLLYTSSASSGISGVVADAKRLIPEGKFVEPNLWIRSSQTSNAKSLIEGWLKDIKY